ncbi:hypothetical protein I7I50_11510 [Histoplasma capsulatum G186AR]|uniref:Uncharacterized protein n=1 Tax=Ajellomyces capsulatus TaxID=5037 RepID=A0A8H7Z5C0_AJECA|nr:hypothetical protein I7I52_02747 [Histoplasma capsulatum]QSS70017.1 hypothetical protein I7I50_11510 [Histoplasma capsulatum G186AR]
MYRMLRYINIFYQMTSQCDRFQTCLPQDVFTLGEILVYVQRHCLIHPRPTTKRRAKKRKEKKRKKKKTSSGRTSLPCQITKRLHRVILSTQRHEKMIMKESANDIRADPPLLEFCGNRSDKPYSFETRVDSQ